MRLYEAKIFCQKTSKMSFWCLPLMCEHVVTFRRPRSCYCLSKPPQYTYMHIYWAPHTYKTSFETTILFTNELQWIQSPWDGLDFHLNHKIFSKNWQTLSFWFWIVDCLLFSLRNNISNSVTNLSMSVNQGRCLWLVVFSGRPWDVVAE